MEDGKEKPFCLVIMTFQRKPEIAVLGRGFCLGMVPPESRSQYGLKKNLSN